MNTFYEQNFSNEFLIFFRHFFRSGKTFDITTFFMYFKKSAKTTRCNYAANDEAAITALELAIPSAVSS